MSASWSSALVAAVARRECAPNPSMFTPTRLLPSPSTLAGALEDYVSGPDPFYNWKRTERKKGSWGTISQLELVSQHWRNQFWSHHVLVVQPNEIRNPGIGFFLITGDGDGEKDIDCFRWSRVSCAVWIQSKALSRKNVARG
jgi:hypothetical protein